VTSAWSIGLTIVLIIGMALIVVVYDELDAAVCAAVARVRRRRAWRSHVRRMKRSRHRR